MQRSAQAVRGTVLGWKREPHRQTARRKAPRRTLDRSRPPDLSRSDPGSYSPPMFDKLNALLERLKAHQRTLILAMAEHDGLPAGSALRQVAELENVIAAVEAVVAEEVSRSKG